MREEEGVGCGLASSKGMGVVFVCDFLPTCYSTSTSFSTFSLPPAPAFSGEDNFSLHHSFCVFCFHAFLLLLTGMQYLPEENFVCFSVTFSIYSLPTHSGMVMALPRQVMFSHILFVLCFLFPKKK